MQQKLQDIQQSKKKQHIKSVPTDTSKTKQSDTATLAETTTSQKTVHSNITHISNNNK